MNERYDIINYWLKSKNKYGITNTNDYLKNLIDNWENLEDKILKKNIKDMEREDRIILYEFFNDEKNKEFLIKIFHKECIEYFLNKCKEINKKEIIELEEIKNYYQNFLFESKKDDIILIEDYFKNNNREIKNYEKYLKDLDNAKALNNKIHIINSIFNSNDIGKNKTELEMTELTERWQNLEKLIKDKKIKKMRFDIRLLLLDYFNNENNKDSLLKIFNQDIIKFFINETTQLKNILEILEYYEYYLFESKKDDIINIKKALDDLEDIEKEKYLKDKDVETAKKMNERYGIIDYIFNIEYNGKTKTEELINKCVKKWEIYEDIIKNKKLNKMRLYNKRIIFEFFNKSENNSFRDIFDNDSYQFFIENYNNEKKKKPIEFF